jgi:PAS domain S-box-containing protein
VESAFDPNNARILQASQSSALEAAGVGTLFFDRKRRVLLSPFASTLLNGGSGAWISYSGFLDRIDPEDRPFAEAALQSAPASPDRFEVRFRPALPGPGVWLLLKGRAEPDGISALLIDISDKVAAEKEIAEQNRLAALRVAIASTLTRRNTLDVILQQCAEHLVSHLKMAFARIWTLDETGQVLELQASAGMYTHLNGPHSRVKVGQFKIGWIAQSRQPHLSNSVTTDPRVGDREWAKREKLVAFAGYPLLVGGNLVGVVAMFAKRELSQNLLAELSPISDWLAQTIERVRVEAELRVAIEKTRENEARKTAILESALDCVIGFDRNGRVLEWNPAAQTTFGYQREQTMGQLLPELIIPERLRDVHRRAVKEYLDTGKGPLLNARVESVGVRADGREFPIEIAITRSDFDGPIFFTATLRDISARRAAEAELKAARDEAEAASLAKSAFLASMSHELRTPLNAIIGYSEILEEEAADLECPQIIPDLARIRSSGKHLLSLINDVLDLSKIEADKMEVYPEQFDVASVVNDIAATARPLVRSNGNRFDVDLAPDAGHMYADVVKVRQCLFNLLSNAGKFTSNGSVHLSVSTERIGGNPFVVFRIEDNGIGIGEEELARLFQPFQQAEGGTSRRFGGTGLGLALTRRFAVMMGGDVSVDSAAGSGSVFTLRLPRQSSPFVPSTPDDPTGAASEPSSRGKILVIDDDPTARDLLRRVLLKEGFHPEMTGSGEEGIRRARQMQPVAITLDVMMPGVDGWSVLAALKADPLTSGIPVIMVTIIDNRNLGFSLGASDYLTKPVDREQLSAILSKYAPGGFSGPVLVVDDDPDARRLIRFLLEREGVQVREAGDGREALQSIDQEHPELILLDLMMPVMDGFEFAAELRKRPELVHIPVVVLTARDLSAADRERLNGHIDRVIQKGAFNNEELLGQLRRLLAHPAS